MYSTACAFHLSLSPDCFSMESSVPMGRSFFGCGTVTRPGFSECVNWMWLPSCPTLRHPSAVSRLMISLLVTVCPLPWMRV